MNVLVVYCHPSEESFTRRVRDSFIEGLKAGGHSYEVSDLYKMGFRTDMSESEYLREGFYNAEAPIEPDVQAEQEKLQRADGVAFIYPVFWTEAPAKLVGWFQRVWTYGYAYGPKAQMKQLEKAIFFATMGGSLEDEVRRIEAEAMKTVMLDDRMYNRAKQKEMIIFDRMTRGYGNDEQREILAEENCRRAYEMGVNF